MRFWGIAVDIAVFYVGEKEKNYFFPFTRFLEQKSFGFTQEGAKNKSEIIHPGMEHELCNIHHFGIHALPKKTCLLFGWKREKQHKTFFFFAFFFPAGKYEIDVKTRDMPPFSFLISGWNGEEEEFL